MRASPRFWNIRNVPVASLGIGKGHFFLISAVVLLTLQSLGTGCNRQSPVELVSTGDSGIEIRNSEWSLSPGDWSAWRGAAQDGIATEGDVPTTWDDASNVLWRSKIPGRGHSSPIVVGDSVFLATANDEQQIQSVLCYDRQDGSQRWQSVLHEGGFPATGSVHRKATHANGTIASDGTRLYIAMLNKGGIIATALDLQGKILWQREVGKFVSKFGYAPSPVLYKSLVLVAADNRGGGYLAAVDSETGSIVWRVGRGNGDSYSSPTVVRVGGRDQLLISGNDAVTSYDPATGQLLWQTACIAEATCGTIVSDGERIFASGGYPESETICLSADGQRLWSNNLKTYEPSLLVVEDRLLTVNDKGVAICWDAASGEELWKERLGGNFSASPILVNGTVMVPNLSGDTFVFQAGKQYVPIAQNCLGDDCYASPALSGNQLFLRIGVGKGSSRTEQLVCLAVGVTGDDESDSVTQEDEDTAVPDVKQ
ncbi:MAG TPA: serine/threonine protein kinase [Rhodopirellula sp.]|nr:serine/threonine protein kinase [Rhodopirellula sp.]